ncbi:FtsB family cell division protein [Paenibacillus harenae]|uniref:Cell division protein DivIC n=1 Tax=Paenibacillus harenae TaxID=306543 RepID=A0ABT9UAB7_PAEHA|nr:septum formation initiator family protein [Paenibacillus harenae]MDQ0063678.1 cell division protein DivIC [Paenibacillus harenae]MDQ0115958.1 cell division protein DivIC [Paenibacillus harenae]
MTTAVNKQTTNAGSKRRIRMWLFIVVLFIGWAAYTLVGKLQEQHATNARLAAIQQQLETAKTDTEALKQEIERLNDPEYISQLATKEQGMVYKGETQIQVVR